MCLIIQQKQGDSLTEAEVHDIYQKNRDGFGAMWLDDDGTPRRWRCVPRTKEHAWGAYQPFAGVECALHWRWATHGRVIRENAHPFHVVDGVTMVHNGVFSGYGSSEQSDTLDFIDRVLRPLLENMPIADAAAAIEKAVKGSAIVLLSRDGFARFGNEGVEHKGRWYSNTYAWSAPREVLPWWENYKTGYYRSRRGREIDLSADDVTPWYPMRHDGDDVDETEDDDIWYDAETELVDGTTADVAAFLATVVEQEDAFLADLLLSDGTDDETLEWAIEQAIDELGDRVAPGFTVVRWQGYMAVVSDRDPRRFDLDESSNLSGE